MIRFIQYAAFHLVVFCLVWGTATLMFVSTGSMILFWSVLAAWLVALYYIARRLA